jgi:hypothetical protein
VRQRPVRHQWQGLDLSKRLSWRIGIPKRHDDEGGYTVLDRQRDRQINTTTSRAAAPYSDVKGVSLTRPTLAPGPGRRSRQCRYSAAHSL